MAEAHLNRVRSICLALPEVTATGGGTPTFKARGKTFANYVDNHHGDGVVGVWCKQAAGVQGLLVDLDPARFFIPPYVGPSGWVGVRLDGTVDWGELANVLGDAWLCAAPPKLRAEHPEGSRTRPTDMDAWGEVAVRMVAPDEPPALRQLRALCLRLPDVTEVSMWGEPAFKVRGKTFANWIPAGRGAERFAVWLKGAPGVQEILIASDPAAYFVPPYLGARGWIGAWLDGRFDRDRLAQLVEEAHQAAAPQRVARGRVGAARAPASCPTDK